MNDKNPINGEFLVYKKTPNLIKEDVKSAPSEEELESGKRACPIIDQIIEREIGSGYDINQLKSHVPEQLLAGLETHIEKERSILIKSKRRELYEAFKRKEAEEKTKTAEKIAVKDQLTNLYNRHYLEPRLSDEMDRSYRNSTPVSILFIDADNFKYVNDGEGLSHEIGDSALIILGEIMKIENRLSDILGRWGGEEFMIILPDTDEKGAMEAGEKLRVKIEKKLKKYLTTLYPDKAEYIEKIDGTISAGTSTYLGGVTGLTNSKKLVEKADTAMYYSKLTGRNKCTAYKPGMENEVDMLKKAKK